MNMSIRVDIIAVDFIRVLTLHFAVFFLSKSLVLV